MNESDKTLLTKVFGCIDHTLLEPVNSPISVRAFAERALNLQCERHVASVCVYPTDVKDACEALKGSDIKVCSVAGGFPHAHTFLSLKVAEVEQAIACGADEVDIVFPLREFFNNDYAGVMKKLAALREAGNCRVMKCILETGVLQSEERIHLAAQMAVEAGYDFIKTSTGKVSAGATPDAVRTMLKVLKKHKFEHGKTVGLKVSGGVSSPELALVYARLAQAEMGIDFIKKQTFRVGTSSLTEKMVQFFGT